MPCTAARSSYVMTVRESQPSSLGLEGALLIAHPNLLDPNFRRTVVYILSHEAREGAFGVIINRSVDKTVGELLTAPNLGPLADVPVFWGGPVSQDRMTFAAFEWDTATQSVNARMNVELEEAKSLVLESDMEVRAFIGYAGWSGGQIEGELEQKAWVVQKPDRDVLDAASCQGLWQNVMKHYGPWFRLLAEAPDDPSLN